jgi:hypothetical protein
MRQGLTLLAALVALSATAAVHARARMLSAATNDLPVLERFLRASDVPLASYRAIRTLSASNGRFRASGWVEAITEFEVDRGFQYTIISEGGSPYIRSKVLRKVLEREAEARLTGEADRSSFTLDNYDFGEPAPDGDGLVRMQIRPRRRNDLMVSGSIVLTAADGDLVRVEGQPAKNPSFWTRRVDFVRRYGRVNGIRLPLGLSSTAHVLLAGSSSFAMCYDYELVNGALVVPRISCP